MDVRGDQERVMKRKIFEFLLHFIPPVLSVFLYSGMKTIFLNFSVVLLVFILQRQYPKHFCRISQLQLYEILHILIVS
jgi:uncharacterized membrane protein YqaE (UPF0057 family)